MKISLIVAMAKNRVIGKENRLPWRLPEDLKRFKAITSGHAVILGRKTFESIGKPLPNRRNIVISRQPGFSAEGVSVVHSPEEALKEAERLEPDKEVFVLGGSEIYRMFLARADRIYLTLIDGSFEGDAFFPEIPDQEFREISREERNEPLRYSFRVLERV
jgi:dihydrofolate reductase